MISYSRRRLKFCHTFELSKEENRTVAIVKKIEQIIEIWCDNGAKYWIFVFLKDSTRLAHEATESLKCFDLSFEFNALNGRYIEIKGSKFQVQMQLRWTTKDAMFIKSFKYLSIWFSCIPSQVLQQSLAEFYDSFYSD